MFQNLIGNALKFRGGKPPRIVITCTKDEEFWLFSFADNGIGIEPEYAERIFVIFQRLHERSAYPGTGIGLAMIRKIIEYYGGRIWLDTTYTAGARFLFTLPMPAETMDDQAPEDEKPEPSGTLTEEAAEPCSAKTRKPMTEYGEARVIDVLLVEDDQGDVLMTREAFEHYKIRNRLHVVTDGEQALQFLHRTGQYADAPRPGLILLDLNLPRRDGLEVLAELKQDDDLLVIPVVMLTTSQAEEDILRSYALHANAFVSKPVDFEHFIEAIRQIDKFFLTLVKLPVSLPRSSPPDSRLDRDRQQGPAVHHVDVDPGQVTAGDRRAALDHQVGRMAGHAVARGGHQPAHDHPPFPGLGHGHQLAFHRPVHLRQVQGDLGAPGLGLQADRAGHARAGIGGGVQLPRRWPRRARRACVLRGRGDPDADAPADQHDAGRRRHRGLPAPALPLLRGAAVMSWVTSARRLGRGCCPGATPAGSTPLSRAAIGESSASSAAQDAHPARWCSNARRSGSSSRPIE